VLWDGRLAGGLSVAVSRRLGPVAWTLEAAALGEEGFHIVNRGVVQARALEAGLLAARPLREGWNWSPEGGLSVEWLFLEAPELVGAADSVWLNPSISLGILAARCEGRWCVAGEVLARAWLHREDLAVGGAGTVATTPAGAVQARLGVRWWTP